MASPEHVKLRIATAQDRTVIASLIQLYLYDMASERPFPIGADGRYDYDFLNAFWEHPYLIYAGDELAGFALVISHCPITQATPCWFMAEIFVLRSHRRKSVARQSVSRILARHPGDWHIAVQTDNLAAARFWASALARTDHQSKSVRFDGADWLVRAFQAGT